MLTLKNVVRMVGAAVMVLLAAAGVEAGVLIAARKGIETAAED